MVRCLSGGVHPRIQRAALRIVGGVSAIVADNEEGVRQSGHSGERGSGLFRRATHRIGDMLDSEFAAIGLYDLIMAADRAGGQGAFEGDLGGGVETPAHQTVGVVVARAGSLPEELHERRRRGGYGGYRLRVRGIGRRHRPCALLHRDGGRIELDHEAPDNRIATGSAPVHVKTRGSGVVIHMGVKGAMGEVVGAVSAVVIGMNGPDYGVGVGLTFRKVAAGGRCNAVGERKFNIFR